MPVIKDEKTGRNTSPKFDLGRNFANKLWNAARFTISMLEKPLAADGSPGSTSGSGKLTVTDKWMLSRLAAATATCERALKEYEYSVYAAALYDLLWRDFCDWYLEAIKPTIAGNPAQRTVLRNALDVILRLMHPVMPFVTEAVFEQLRTLPAAPAAGISLSDGPTLAQSSWPRIDPMLRDPVTDARVERLRALVSGINQIRAQHNVPPKRKIVLHATAALLGEIAAGDGAVEALAGLAEITTQPAAGAAVAFTFEAAELKLSSLTDAIDSAADAERLAAQLVERQRDVLKLEARLNAPGYAERAPAHLVEQSRQQLTTRTAERDALLASLRPLKEHASSLLADRAGSLDREKAQLDARVTDLTGALGEPKQPINPEQKKARDELKKAREQLAAKTEEHYAAQSARELLA
jgi:valyl-tRNA synthetase